MAATIIDNGGSGYSEVGSWSNFSDASYYGGTIRFKAAGSGTAMARATFTSLTAGVSYKVGFRWGTDGSGMTNAPWRVYDSDNSTVLGSGTFNTRVAASGFTDSGKDWKELGVYAPTGTSLRVEIDDNGAGGNVNYDAAWLDVFVGLTIDRSNILCGSGTVTVSLTGFGTSWTGTPFSLTGAPTGWSISSQNVISGTSATVTLNKGSGTGAFSITDGTNSDSVTATNTATSAADGAWSTAATWDVLEVPVSGNLVSIISPHDVTVSGSRACGNSPAEGNVVLTIQLSASLTVQTGGSLTVKGAVSNSGIFQVGETGGGGTLEYDASSATDPTNQQYQTLLAVSTAIFRSRGTAGAHSVIRSNASGGNAYLTGPGGAGGGIWDFEWCDFLRIGDATNPAINMTGTVNPASATMWLTLSDCTFTSCGRVFTASSFPSNADWNVVRTKFASSLHATESLRILGNTPGGGVTRTINLCSFDKLLYYDATTNLSNSMLGGAIDHANTGVWNEIAGCVFWADDVGSGAFALRGDQLDCYYFAGGTDNPHFPLTRDNGVANVGDGCIVEYGGTFSTDAGNTFYGAGNWTLQNSIVLPAGQGGANDASGALTTLGTLATTHCTLHSPDYSGGILIGDGGSSTGMYPTAKSNIFWARQADADGVAAHSIGTTADNALTPGSCTHNGLLNIAATAYQGSYPTTQPGANDARLDNTAETTVFVDPTRNMASWAVSQGSVSGTYAGKVADAKSYLMADPSLIASLLAHVRSGFRVKYTAWRTAAHDGTVLGAVQGSVQSGGARRVEIKIGQPTMIGGY